jgi:membrane protein DedA with SNARE-associated domain
MTPALVADFLRRWGYQAYFGLFLLTPVGSPITEDILLLAGGFLVGEGVFDLRVVVPLVLVGMVVSDLTLYGFGRYLRTHHTRRQGLLSRLVRPARIRVASRWFGRYGDAAIFVARLLPGTRFICFVGAGMSGVPPWRFLIYNVAGTLVWAPLLLFVGFWLRDQIGGLGDVVRWVEQRVLWLALALVLVVAVRQYWLRHVRLRRVGSRGSGPRRSGPRGSNSGGVRS